MDLTLEIPYKANKKQAAAHLAILEFHANEKRIESDPKKRLNLNILYGGGLAGGKSHWLCICILHHVFQFPGAMVALVRKEATTLRRSTLMTLLKLIPAEIKNPKIGWSHNQQMGIIIFPNNSIIHYGGAGTPDEVQRYGSTEYSLICMDEAGEIDLEPFQFLQGRLRHKLPDGTRPDYNLLLASNPSHNWLKHHFIDSPKRNYIFIQALSSDNLENLNPNYENNLLASYPPEWVDKFLRGDWNALSGADVVIPYEYIKAAVNKELPVVDKPVIGVDPAGTGGDENAIVYANGNTILGISTNRKQDPMVSCAKIAYFANKKKAKKILIETDGLGDVFLSRLRGMGIKATGYKSGGNSFVSDKEVYYNHKTEAYFYARTLFEDGLVSIPDDKKLIDQLASVKYEIRESHGKLKIESKKDMSKKMGNSPDRADAVVIALWAAKGMRDPKRDFARRVVNKVTRGNSYGWTH